MESKPVMRSVLFGVGLILAISAQGAPPPMKYECRATVGQDWFKGGRDHVYARTKKFIITEADYSEGIQLTNKDFTEFYQTEAKDLTLGDGTTVVTKGRSSFKESDLENEFRIWINIRGAWKDGPYTRLTLESSFTIALADLANPLSITTQNSGDSRPKKLENDMAIRLPKQRETTGPIYYSLTCIDQISTP